MPTIRSIYGDKVKQDVVQDLVQTHYQAALSEHQLAPISYPNIEFDSVNDTQNFKFSAAFEVRPTVVVKTFEKLKVQKEVMPNLDAKVNETLENIRTNKATLVTVFEDRPAQKGDTVEIDFVGYQNDVPFEGGKADNMALELGSGRFIPGFEEGLEGARAGQQRTLNLKFPDDYGSANLAGQPVRFEVTVKALKKKSLPELNDEFAKSLGSYESLEAFKNVVREDIQQNEDKRIKADLKSRVLRALVESNPVDVPKSLLQEQKEALMKDVSQRMQSQGLSEQDFDDYAEKWNT
jgi:trigger factor